MNAVACRLLLCTRRARPRPRRRGPHLPPRLDFARRHAGWPFTRRCRHLGHAWALLDTPAPRPYRHRAAAGIALVNSLGNLGGGFVGNNLLGQLREKTGSDLLGLMLAASTLIIAAIIVLRLKFDPHAPPAFPIDPNAEEQQVLADSQEAH